MKKRILGIYEKLYGSFGPQGWWPADTPFEVVIGAILTQNTSWQNVERAIANLKKKKALSFKKIYAMNESVLGSYIRPAGYYNIKARRIKNFLSFLKKNYGGDLKKMLTEPVGVLRPKLLSVNGIGPETADSILLYALGKPVFVVDAYTKRIFSRHKLAKPDIDYHSMQALFMDNLSKDAQLFNEYHALLVKVGKDFCKKPKARCKECPVNEYW